MKKLLVAIMATFVAITATAYAGPDYTPQYGNTKISLGQAIKEGWIKPYSDYWYDGGGIDTRYGGTKQPVGGGGIRDMRTDLWGGGEGGGIVVNPFTDAPNLMIVPAHKKPIPVTTPAAILTGSKI